MMILLFYAFIASLIILFDQITKYIVMSRLTVPYEVNDYISIDLLINRGVSWGLFSSKSSYLFTLVTVLVGLVLVLLVMHMIDRVRNGKRIVGELLVLAGGLSNLADRVMHQGVVDFILISFNGWSWPMFNAADCFIVLGVGIMFASVWNEHR